MSHKPYKSYKSSHANPWVVLGLSVLLAATMVVSCMFGAVDISWDEIVWRSPIFWQLRLPRVLMGALVGAVLSVWGRQWPYCWDWKHGFGAWAAWLWLWRCSQYWLSTR